MPTGNISRVVHLSLQSAASADCSPAQKGYGYLVGPDDRQPIYFDAKVVKEYTFDDLQVGQEVDFELDPKLPIAKSVSVSGEVLAAPTPQIDLLQ